MMPAQYEAMRDKFEEGGMGSKAAKGKAARIFNAKRGKGVPPVTGRKETLSKKRNPFKRAMA